MKAEISVDKGLSTEYLYISGLTGQRGLSWSPLHPVFTRTHGLRHQAHPRTFNTGVQMSKVKNKTR